METLSTSILEINSIPTKLSGNGFWRVSVRAVRYYFNYLFFWFYYAEPGAGGRS
jgi:hypothetical protein